MEIGERPFLFPDRIANAVCGKQEEGEMMTKIERRKSKQILRDAGTFGSWFQPLSSFQDLPLSGLRLWVS